MKTLCLCNIQKFSIHDGPGIRTTVFFKGCPLRCGWCHNPESQSAGPELLFFADRCVGCGACVPRCPRGAVSMSGGLARTDRRRCDGCGACTEACHRDARRRSGQAYDLEALTHILLQDRVFYETSGGGVTLSGGEVFAQDPTLLEALCHALRARDVSLAADTCGAVPWERMERLLPLLDLILYDVKLMDSPLHRRHTGGGNEEILDNLCRLAARGARLWIRVPVTGGVNDNPEEMERLRLFLGAHHIRPERLCLLPYHDTGSGKYAQLGRIYEPPYHTPTRERLQELSRCFRGEPYPIEIGG